MAEPSHTKAGNVQHSSMHGVRIVVTRPLDEATPEGGILEQHLRALGGEVVRLPLVSIAPCSFSPPEECCDWLFFTSKNGVRAYFSQRPPHRMSSPAPLIAVVGPSTGAALKAYGQEAHFISPYYDAEGAANAFLAQIGAHQANGMRLRILWPCGNLANPRLAEILTSAGFRLTPLIVYETTLRTTLTADEEHQLAQAADCLVFTSPSAIDAYQGLRNEHWPPAEAIACLGPKTRQTALAVFGRVDIQAASPTLESLAEAIATYYSPEGAQPCRSTPSSNA